MNADGWTLFKAGAKKLGLKSRPKESLMTLRVTTRNENGRERE